MAFEILQQDSPCEGRFSRGLHRNSTEALWLIAFSISYDINNLLGGLFFLDVVVDSLIFILVA